MTPIIIGIAGGSGSGKTTLAGNLKKEFDNDIAILCGNNHILGLK